MPDAKDNAKATGDVHPPEVEETKDAPVARDQQDEATPGKGINQAGYLKDKDVPGTGGGNAS